MKSFSNSGYWIALALGLGLSVGLISTQLQASTKPPVAIDVPPPSSMEKEVNALENIVLDAKSQSGKMRDLITID